MRGRAGGPGCWRLCHGAAGVHIRRAWLAHNAGRAAHRAGHQALFALQLKRLGRAKPALKRVVVITAQVENNHLEGCSSSRVRRRARCSPAAQPPGRGMAGQGGQCIRSFPPPSGAGGRQPPGRVGASMLPASRKPAQAWCASNKPASIGDSTKSNCAASRTTGSATGTNSASNSGRSASGTRKKSPSRRLSASPAT